MSPKGGGQGGLSLYLLVHLIRERKLVYHGGREEAGSSHTRSQTETLHVQLEEAGERAWPAVLAGAQEQGGLLSHKGCSKGPTGQVTSTDVTALWWMGLSDLQTSVRQFLQNCHDSMNAN